MDNRVALEVPSPKAIGDAKSCGNRLDSLFNRHWSGGHHRGWGARIETAFDNHANKINTDHLDNWYSYPRTAFVADPIGRRCIRSLVLRLKFELGVLFASIVAAVGLVLLLWLGMNCSTAVTLILLCLALAGWQFIEARATHEALAICRKELLGEIRIVQGT